MLTGSTKNRFSAASQMQESFDSKDMQDMIEQCKLKAHHLNMSAIKTIFEILQVSNDISN